MRRANQMKKPELLIPAGSLEVLKTAVNFGADASFVLRDEWRQLD